MANGHSVIPLDGEKLAKESIKYVEVEMVYVPENVPVGRFPTLTELREVILAFDYQLEEKHDWYVTSNDDHTEIWFSENGGFWFRRGDIIVLNIMQSLANQCGSFLVWDHTGAGIILIVPDSMFGEVTQSQDQLEYVGVISRRLPLIIKRLDAASLEDTLFLLSQIHQILHKLDYVRQHELFAHAQQGLSSYIRLLKHNDARIRYMAFDIVIMLRERVYESYEALGAAIKNEVEPNTKARMIWVLEKILARNTHLDTIDQRTRALLDILLAISNNDSEVSSVRFAAANVLARSQPGFISPSIHTIFVDALVRPEQYIADWNSDYFASYETLESMKVLLFHQRIAILLEALPKINIAQDAHDVLRILLDNIFFGEVRTFWMSSLPDTKEAERPEVGMTQFRDNLSRSWLYPANPVKVTISDLLPFQRQVLETVMALDIPWMVHSNLLEKYGFPATRSAVRALLKDSF